MRTAYLEVGLDTLSFFLVTTDLYGKENLDRLNGRLSTSFAASRSLKFDKIFLVVFVGALVLSYALFYQYGVLLLLGTILFLAARVISIISL
jgi:hypothetical protein